MDIDKKSVELIMVTFLDLEGGEIENTGNSKTVSETEIDIEVPNFYASYQSK
jgi:hypothetical protein